MTHPGHCQHGATTTGRQGPDATVLDRRHSPPRGCRRRRNAISLADKANNQGRGTQGQRGDGAGDRRRTHDRSGQGQPQAGQRENLKTSLNKPSTDTDEGRLSVARPRHSAGRPCYSPPGDAGTRPSSDSCCPSRRVWTRSVSNNAVGRRRHARWTRAAPGSLRLPPR
jgi:hypothetical protein